MRKLSIVLTVLLSVLLAFVACDNSIDIGLDTKVDPYKTPLTLEFLEDGRFWVDYDDPSNILIEYSINGGEREVFESDDEPIDVKKGYKVCFYRDVVGVKSIPYYSRIQCDSQCYVYGNVMSLIDPMNFATEKNVHGDSLMGLFCGNTNIINHDEIDLVLPATSLSERCYEFMFYGCTGLTRAPELPAKTLANSCYKYMFSGCTSLTTAPKLPAEQLANSCYVFMFENCKSLTTAPDLPVTVLAEKCYEGMFSDCIKLETAPELPAMTLAVSCYKEMFAGCTSLTTAPVLPATQLAKGCYAYMFNACSSLNSITCLATDISADNCTNEWMNNAGSAVADTKTFYRNHEVDDAFWYGTVPANWTIKDVENP